MLPSSNMYSNTVISLFDLKQAVLYFEYAIPCDHYVEVYRDIAWCVRHTPPWGSFPRFQEGAEKVMKDVIPPTLRNDEKFKLGLFEFQSTLAKKRKHQMKIFPHDVDGKLSYTFENKNTLSLDRKATRRFFSEFGLSELPVDGTGYTGPSPKSGGEIAVSLAGLRLIDTSDTPWEQLLEFRKDKDAQMKLRRLRLFFHENYAQRSRDFIEDDLAVRIADYEETAKQLGFQTVEASVTALQDSTLVKGGFAIAAVATLLHEPVTAIVSAAVPVVLNISGAALKVHKERRDLKRALERNPVSFVKIAADKLIPRG